MREFYSDGYRLDIHGNRALIVRAGIVRYAGTEADCREFLDRIGVRRTTTVHELLIEEGKAQLTLFRVGK